MNFALRCYACISDDFPLNELLEKKVTIVIYYTSFYMKKVGFAAEKNSFLCAPVLVLIFLEVLPDFMTNFSEHTSKYFMGHPLKVCEILVSKNRLHHRTWALFLLSRVKLFPVYKLQYFYIIQRYFDAFRNCLQFIRSQTEMSGASSKTFNTFSDSKTYFVPLNIYYSVEQFSTSSSARFGDSLNGVHLGFTRPP